jgi:hypothetical protein
MKASCFESLPVGQTTPQPFLVGLVCPAPTLTASPPATLRLPQGRVDAKIRNDGGKWCFAVSANQPPPLDATSTRAKVGEPGFAPNHSNNQRRQQP